MADFPDRDRTAVSKSRGEVIAPTA